MFKNFSMYINSNRFFTLLHFGLQKVSQEHFTLRQQRKPVPQKIDFWQLLKRQSSNSSAGLASQGITSLPLRKPQPRPLQPSPDLSRWGRGGRLFLWCLISAPGVLLLDINYINIVSGSKENSSSRCNITAGTMQQSYIHNTYMIYIYICDYYIILHLPLEYICYSFEFSLFPDTGELKQNVDSYLLYTGQTLCVASLRHQCSLRYHLVFS